MDCISPMRTWSISAATCGQVQTTSAYDPKVRGNLRRLDTPGNYGNGCIFNEHYYLKCNGKYYDPCLSTTYSVKNQSIKEEFSGQYQNTAYGTGQTAGRMLLTADKKTCIVYLPKEPVPGFRGAWGMFEASKKNVEKPWGARYSKRKWPSRVGIPSSQRP
jgi:hypothetical protein